MKDKGKKILGGIIVFCALMIVMSVSAFAKAGDYVGSSKFSDIVVYINHYAIPSTNYNGDMYVNIQQLKNYGFATSWNQDTKTTTVKLSGETTIYPIDTYMPAPLNVGKYEWSFCETDVKVNINGKYVQAYGSGGEEILIKAKDLANLDNVSYNWVPEIKSVKIWINNGLEMRSTPQYPEVYRGYMTGVWRVTYLKNSTDEYEIPWYADYLFEDLDIHLESNHTGYTNGIKFTWEPLVYADGNIGIVIFFNSNGLGSILDYTYDGELRWDFDNGSTHWYRKL